MPKIKPMTSGFTPTQSGKYYTKDGSNKLFARVGDKPAKPPLELGRANDKRVAKGKEETLYKAGGDLYEKYKVDPRYRKDCLHTTEETMYRAGGPGRENHKLKPEGDYSLEKTTGKPFGVDDAENRKVARAARKAHPDATNEHAAPGRGEGFATVRTSKVNQDVFQYHAAPVVAKDGKDRITNEIFGDPNGVGASRHNQPTTLQKYTVGDPDNSFHGQWKGSFDKGPITVALKTNPDISADDLVSNKKRRTDG